VGRVSHWGGVLRGVHRRCRFGGGGLGGVSLRGILSGT